MEMGKVAYGRVMRERAEGQGVSKRKEGRVVGLKKCKRADGRVRGLREVEEG